MEISWICVRRIYICMYISLYVNTYVFNIVEIVALKKKVQEKKNTIREDD